MESTTPTLFLDVTADGEAAPVGPVVGDRYELRDEIAGGGMGIVYTARDRTLGRNVAVKVLRPELTKHPRIVARFVEEARIAGQLQHPGIAPVHDLGTLPDGRPFLAMKLIKGRTLADLLHERASPAAELPRFLIIFEAVCQAVGYAHNMGVIHRDLKPANVMVGAFGEVQVMDWGLAKSLGSPDADHLRPDEPTGTAIDAGRDPESHTQAGSLMGTPAYMPPEQAKGEVEKVDQRADVFALGAVLCEILTGQPPYTGTFAELKARAVMGLVEPALARLGECRADWRVLDLCRRCLRPDPRGRPESAAAVAAALLAARTESEEVGREQELVALRQSGTRAATVHLLCTLCLVDDLAGNRPLADAWLRFTDSLSGPVEAELRDYCRSLDRYGRPDLAYRVMIRWLDRFTHTAARPASGVLVNAAWFALRWATGSEMAVAPDDPTRLADQAAVWLDAELDAAAGGGEAAEALLKLLAGKSSPTQAAWDKLFRRFPHLGERREQFVARLAELQAGSGPPV